ncbi:spore coat U domain-containing protein [Pseudomonas sp. NPDC086251]|uniref:Csu type fimbrial protein n=1 Tax=Pseudomonas sp. NPDC086251 TaxID=3364431 RepID=UPI0038331358
MMLTSGTLVQAAEFQVQVHLNVQRGCQMIEQRDTRRIEQAGALDFGATSRLDPLNGPLSAELDTSRVPHLVCNPDTLYQVQVDGGQHGGVGDVRYLATTVAPAQSIPYRIYQDAARHRPLSVNVPFGGRVADSGVAALPLYARIDRLADIPHVGHYSDVLKVTLSW